MIQVAESSKFLKESSLLDQPFVKDPDTQWASWLQLVVLRIVHLFALKWATVSRLKKWISLLKLQLRLQVLTKTS